MFDFGDDGFWDLETEDFAILGGILGYAEEECEDMMRLEKELEADGNTEQDEQDRCTQCCDSGGETKDFLDSFSDEDFCP